MRQRTALFFGLLLSTSLLISSSAFADSVKIRVQSVIPAKATKSPC